MQNPSPWRWPNSSRDSSPKNPYIQHLQHTVSLADLQNGWNWNSRPTSSSSTSSSSSSSYGERAATPTASSYSSLSRSRTPTPTSPVTPFKIPLFSEKPSSSTSPTNPFVKAMMRSSPPVTPDSSPLSSSPESNSRSSTPVAPQPLRPFMVDPAIVPARYEFSRPPSAAVAYFAANIAPCATPSQSSVIEDDKLAPQFITPELVQQVLPNTPQIFARQGWKSASMVYQWAIKQPKTALLLWMCDDLAAWKGANLYQLKDSMLPYHESDVKGIATNPARVVELQWKVAIKQLPRNGAHTEFQTQDTVPLKEVREIGFSPKNKSQSKSLACVKYRDGTTSAVYVRKRLEVRANRPQDKEAILAQIRHYHRLDHSNILRIVSSYARGLVVAFVTPFVQTNLADYLEVFSGASHADQLLSWITDISSAVAYLHSKRVVHRSIRPQKILVDPITNQIYLTVFGIAHPARAGSALLAAYSTDPQYVYAAPETMAMRELGSAADVFSLGCVFLEMASAARGVPVKHLVDYRAAQTHDLSYHANLDCIAAWMELLHSAKLGGSSGSGSSGGGSVVAGGASGRKDRVAASVSRVLVVVKGMLAAEPTARPTTKRVAAHLAEAGVGRARRRSVDLGLEWAAATSSAAAASAWSLQSLQSPAPIAMERTGIWSDLESLQSYYQYSQHQQPHQQQSQHLHHQYQHHYQV